MMCEAITLGLLRTFQVLQNPSQLHASLSFLPNSMKLPLHTPEREWTRSVTQPGLYTAHGVKTHMRRCLVGTWRICKYTARKRATWERALPSLPAQFWSKQTTNPPFENCTKKQETQRKTQGIRWNHPYLEPSSSSSNTTISSTRKMAQARAICPARYVRNAGDCALFSIEPGKATLTV